MKLFIFSFLLVLNAAANFESFSFPSDRSLYIIDGDSVSLQMRLAGIDTPEIKQKCRKRADKMVDCGQLSKHYLKKLLKKLPGEITITPIAIDGYQRILVRVYKGDVNVGKRMVEVGMAFSYKDTYKLEEQTAKAEKLGFWSFDTPPIRPYKWRKQHR
ncbi:thermonuclease family protein [Candidatus Thioglobus sp.]|uniref:thermonuclease family protein n=1 Tax=Candidatus Thioglobus sp. TaxID=2026721 RepID=UPI003D0C19C8